MTIAALYVQTDGVYQGLEGVDPWGCDFRTQAGLFERDARRYSGPWPVVAHPPCARWCALAGLVEHLYGHKRGDDGGCFEAALAAVRRWGGVLEHPAYSRAWEAFGLGRPNRAGGWVTADDQGGWTCHVEQGRYGHKARKATWLYASRCKAMPDLLWGSSDASAWVSWLSNHGEPKTQVSDLGRGRKTRGERLSPKQASQTPPAFRDVLLSIARSVHQPRT